MNTDWTAITGWISGSVALVIIMAFLSCTVADCTYRQVEAQETEYKACVESGGTYIADHGSYNGHCIKMRWY